MPGVAIGGVTFDAHTLLFASLAILCGYQSVLFAIFSKTFAISEGLLPENPRMTRFFQMVTLERGLLLGFGALVIGVVLLLISRRMFGVRLAMGLWITPRPCASLSLVPP